MNVWTHPRFDIDVLGNNLAYWGGLARAMPPAWAGACISQPIGTDGGKLGRMLPGKGLLLDTDLKELGFRKPPQYVYERSLFLRLTDKWARRKVSDRMRAALAANHIGYSIDLLDRLVSERGALSTYDGIVSARVAQTGAPLDIVINKPSVTSVANQWHSLFMQAGTPAAATITATNGAIMTAANSGAWNIPWQAANTSTTNRNVLSFGWASSQQLNMALLHDVLWAGGPYTVGASGTTSITQPALTRNTGGAGTLIITEVTTLFGGTAATMGINYHNQANAAQTGTAVGVRSTAAIVTMLQPSLSGNLANNQPWFVYNSGDYGARTVDAIVMGGTAMSTGAVNAYLYFPLLWVPGVASNAYIERDSTVQIDGLIALAQDTSFISGCLNAWVVTNATTSGAMNVFMRSCVG